MNGAWECDRREGGMLTSVECQAQAEAKLAQADRDGGHRRRLITAAEAWLILASRMRRLEAQLGSPVQKP